MAIPSNAAVMALSPTVFSAIAILSALTDEAAASAASRAVVIKPYVCGRDENAVCCRAAGSSIKSNRLPMPSLFGGAATGFSNGSFSRLMNVRNSSSRYISARACTSSFLRSRLSGVMSPSGTSVFIVARNFEKRIASALSISFFCSAPFIWWVLSRRFSTEPQVFISLAAVFSPTPGHPGMLSLTSPSRASRSITWAGVSMPYFSLTSLGPRISKPSPRSDGRYMNTRSVTSCP